MSSSFLSRRSFFGVASSTAVAAALPSQLGGIAFAQSNPEGLLKDVKLLPESLEKAFQFQNFMMDAYATGSTVRLAQSYSDEALGATAFTYDNAVAIHGYLGSEDSDLRTRAEVLGDGLLYAQANNFPVADGRFAQAYFVNVATSDGAFITPAAFPFYFYGSAVGDQAWAGMALAQLYKRTGKNKYLKGATLVGDWIATNTYNTLGPGGFSFGTNINQYNQSVPSPNGKSTEHNIDCTAFFTMLAELTDDGLASTKMRWSELAKHAKQFVKAMYNEAGPYFYTGTLGDQITINTTPIPEDCQTWSYMTLLEDGGKKKTIDWAIANLSTTDTSSSPHTSLTGSAKFSGIVFDTASLTTTADDPNAVWLEGTAHTAAALAARVLQGGDPLAKLFADITRAIGLLEDCVHAQKLLGVGKTAGGKAIPQGLGLVAATSVMDTGFGYTYGPSLHLGATGWYTIAGYAANPFQLGYRPSPYNRELKRLEDEL